MVVVVVAFVVKALKRWEWLNDRSEETETDEVIVVFVVKRSGVGCC